VYPAATATSSDPFADQLAKSWLVGVIERTPLDQVRELDLDVLTREASPLIAAILDGLDAGRPALPGLSSDASRRARELGRLRPAARACAEVPRDLAVLQSVLIASLHRGGPGGRSSDFGRSVQRLAEIFGSLHGAVAEGLVRKRDLTDPPDRPAAFPGSADLEGWLAVLVAEHRRYGRPFAVAVLELDGLGRIVEAHGRRSGELMSTAASTVIRNQIRIVDHAFQVGDDAFCVLAPDVDAGRLRRMADRLARVVEASQAADSPRIAISAGVSACPEHGHDASRLLDVAGAALEAAKAAGEPVQIAAVNGSRPAA
jgi:diguanylate cyclase (GGDEF)-like protein